MSELQTAQEAVLKAITDVVKDAEGYGGTTRSAMVRDAAIAWRAMRGGPQPGNVVVESN